MKEQDILAHARRCAPAESCGFVVRTQAGERYLPCVNISAAPEDYFRMAPEDWLRAETQGILWRWFTAILAASRI
ncbi:Tail fiber component K [Salmonella enterica subsp. enterica]|uniref:Tail fiber component K n=1 Tax=Salmonella enterica I TaxID=59201 RepID=A0A379WAC6_SALET|nr:Tail fiber component K [Salmonella enterica subsp. enterica]